MKRLVVFTILLLIFGVAARADTILAVSLNPVDYGQQVSKTGQIFGDEIVAVTFTWDVTTETLSNIVVAASGPFQGYSVPGSISASLWPGGSTLGGPAIGKLDFQLIDTVSQFSVLYSLNYSFHNIPGSAVALPAIPGTYYADLNLFCGFCISGDEFSSGATATVTNISTPEPGTLSLVAVGLLGWSLRKRKKRVLSPN
jgi:hypothetical protein